MAQFMDSSVSPIKMKTWRVESGVPRGRGVGLITRRVNTQKVYHVPDPSINSFNPQNTSMRQAIIPILKMMKLSTHRLSHFPYKHSWEGQELRFKTRYSHSKVSSEQLYWPSTPLLYPGPRTPTLTPASYSHRWPQCYHGHRQGTGRGRAQSPGGQQHRPVGQPGDWSGGGGG